MSSTFLAMKAEPYSTPATTISYTPLWPWDGPGDEDDEQDPFPIFDDTL